MVIPFPLTFGGRCDFVLSLVIDDEVVYGNCIAGHPLTRSKLKAWCTGLLPGIAGALTNRESSADW